MSPDILPKSLMITGAPATGKTTLSQSMIDRCQTHKLGLDYTTREPRSGEVHGIHRYFISKDDFESMFSQNKFLEPSLEFAEYNGHYYGTPREWTAQINKGTEPIVVSPVSVQIAQMIKELSKDRVLWIHLVANQDDRGKRLISRGIPPEEVSYRLAAKNGDTFNYVSVADRCVDTSELNIAMSLTVIIRALWTP